MRILITGVSGYIGSCLYSFLKNKFEVIGIDKKKNKLINKNFKILNLLNKKKLFYFFKKSKKIDLIIHLAGESTIDNIAQERDYKKNNVNVTKNILDAATHFGICKIIFSSTAAVYKSTDIEISENSPILTNNIYGKTKLECEELIKKKFKKKKYNFIIFRFFNVCSSLYEKRIGEMHTPETHLIPILTNKILRSQIFKIYGSNYNTKDGTCIRDYIHIKDLCVALYLAIKRINNKGIKEIINLGTGKGFTVLEILKSILKKIKKQNKFSYFFSSERSGDSSKLVCSNKKAFRILKWKPRYSNLNKILNDELMWQKFLNSKKIKKINKY